MQLALKCLEIVKILKMNKMKKHLLIQKAHAVAKLGSYHLTKIYRESLMVSLLVMVFYSIMKVSSGEKIF